MACLTRAQELKYYAETAFILHRNVIPYGNLSIQDCINLCNVFPFFIPNIHKRFNYNEWRENKAFAILIHIIQHHKLPVATHIEFHYACFHGSSEMGIWLHCSHPQFCYLSNSQCILKRNCAHNRIKIIQMLYDFKQFNDTHISLAFIPSCIHNSLEIMQWLYEKFPRDITANRKMLVKCLYISSANGYLRVVRWLLDTFKLTSDEIKQKNNLAFRNSCIRGHLEIAQTIHEHAHLVQADIRANKCEAFCVSCSRGYLHVAKWIHNEFHLTSDDARAYDDGLFTHSCARGRLQVAQWLYETFNLREKDITLLTRYYHSFYKRKHILKWLQHTFPKYFPIYP